MPATSTENTILDRWESGQPCRLIARETGIPLTRVEKIVRNTACSAEDRVHRTRMATASATLRDAILARTRPVPARSHAMIWNTRTLADVAQQLGALA